MAFSITSQSSWPGFACMLRTGKQRQQSGRHRPAYPIRTKIIKDAPHRKYQSQDKSSSGNGTVEPNTIGTLSKLSMENGTVVNKNLIPAPRGAVLKACVLTSCGLAASGLILREASHWATKSGWLSLDCTLLMPFDFQIWHLGVVLGTVFTVSTLRQYMLSVWTEFASSTQTSNYQILGALNYLDFVMVSFLSGAGEELFFRGSLLPLVGANWNGVMLAGIVFGGLHLSGGRNNAFAIWATCVGIVYGATAVWTSDVMVPILAHSLANLIAAIIWRQKQFDDLPKA